jgi:hypothetical protein
VVPEREGCGVFSTSGAEHFTATYKVRWLTPQVTGPHTIGLLPMRPHENPYLLMVS